MWFNSASMMHPFEYMKLFSTKKQNKSMTHPIHICRSFAQSYTHISYCLFYRNIMTTKLVLVQKTIYFI